MNDVLDLVGIRHEVFQRTGINISLDDPFMAALVMLAVAAERIDANNQQAIDQLATLPRELSAVINHHQARQSAMLMAAAKDVTAEAKNVTDAAERLTGVRGDMQQAAAGEVARLLQPVMKEITTVLDRLRYKDSFSQDLAQKAQRIAERSASTGWIIALSTAVSLLVVAVSAYRYGVASCVV